MIELNRQWLGGLMFAVVFPGTAQAQILARSFDELRQILKADETIVVTDESGRQTKGRLAEISATSLTVLAPERLIFAERAVAQIRRTDSIWNGTLLGAAAGGAVYLGGLMFCEANKLDCGAAGGAEVWMPGSPMTAWLAPAAGAILGALVDRAKGNAVIYVTPSRRPALSVSPWLGRQGSGVSVFLRF